MGGFGRHNAVGLAAALGLLAVFGAPPGVPRRVIPTAAPRTAPAPPCPYRGDVRCQRGSGLGARVHAGQPERERTAGGLLTVRVPIHNVSPQQVRLAVRIDFVDRAGHRCGDRSTRRLLDLGPRQRRWVVATSTRRRASDVVVHLLAE